MDKYWLLLGDGLERVVNVKKEWINVRRDG